MKQYYCNFIKNDTIFGVTITYCCKKHDNDTGINGSYNFIKHSIDFYNCLKLSGLNTYQALLISGAATIGVMVRLPYFIYKKYNQK